MQGFLAPFRGTALHYAAAYLDAVCLGAVRDMSDRQVFQFLLSENRSSVYSCSCHAFMCKQVCTDTCIQHMYLSILVRIRVHVHMIAR